uniref:Protein kinase domain-containing protein n=1 Tax=Mesocestoides corti TaxID=53468 RepID=A0A5K3EGR1_MESCO
MMIPNVSQLPPSLGQLGLRGEITLTKLNEQMVAVKWFRSSISPRKRLKELEILGKLQGHRSIVNLLAAGPDYQNGFLEFLITEFASEGDLSHLIHKRKSVEYNLSNAFTWILQLSEALAYLHERCTSAPIIHRDVKPANCLLFGGGSRLKLCDFGSSECCGSPKTLSSTRRGTRGFMAPEFLTENPASITYSVKCDVFSASMTFWEILSRQHVCPPDEPFFVTLIQQVHKHRRPKPLPGCPIFLLRLFDRSWDIKPERRPRMSEIAELFGSIKTHMLDTGILSKSLFIPIASPVGSFVDTFENQWEPEDEQIEDAPQSYRVEDCPAEELRILSNSPIRCQPCELSIVCDDVDADKYE